MPAALCDSEKQTIQVATRKLTGWRRRQFQAEMTLKHCQGRARQAEQLFGWARDTVHTGLNELRSGIRCWDNFSARGRHKTEEQRPELVKDIHALVEPTSQADPKFQTPLAYTRITARAVREQLMGNAQRADQPVPAERTVYDILHRLGYRLRRVRKTKPQKKSRKPTRSSITCGKSTHRPSKTQKPSAFPWTPKPK
jgi:transposase